MKNTIISILGHLLYEDNIFKYVINGNRILHPTMPDNCPQYMASPFDLLELPEVQDKPLYGNK